MVNSDGSGAADIFRHIYIGRLSLVVAVVLLSILPAIPVWAADPQPYTVSIAETGNEKLDQALADHSMLISLKDEAPVGPFALVMRANEDRDRFRDALHSFGYYQGATEIRITGMAVDDPELVGILDEAPADPPVQVEVSVEPGPLYHLGKVEIRGEVPDHVRQELKVAPGNAAVAAEVLDGQERLLNALRDDGYAFAKVDEPIAIVRDYDKELDIVYTAEAGPRMELGAITITGLEYIQEAYVKQHLLVHPGERYSPAELEKARQDLMAIGTFSSVQVIPAAAPDAQGRLPVEFRIRERKRHKVSFNGQYSTDVGGSVSVAWQNRDLLGKAEQLSLSAAVTQIGGNSTQGIGYNAVLSFLKPDFLGHDQSLRADLGAVKESLLAYDRQAFTLGALLKRKLADRWRGSIGLSLEQENVEQQGIRNDFTLISLPMEVKYDSTTSLLDPTHGTRASALITPTKPLIGPNTSPFVLMQVSGSTYLDLSDSGRSILALRGIIGLAEGASQAELPPDRRFYAGGSATVRGYKYQSIGPQFPDETPQGGTALSAGTVEFRQRFLDSYGAVVFVDAGQVTTNSTPFTGPWRIGAGFGARYYTSFGPIRLDVAIPVNPGPGSGSFEIYVGLGQAF